MPIKIRDFYKQIPFAVIKKNIVSHFAPILLGLLTFVIALRNYDPGTFLTGWDTLHPEFNFNIYWPRILDAVWQTHQGLGAVGSQAHASEIPRILIMEFLSLFLYLDQLRYGFAFFMLVAGPLGVYIFLNRIILKNLSSQQARLGAFSGGLLYLLNLGTLQHYYVPLEMFLVHYGLLGLVMYSACKYFEDGSRRHITLFLLMSLLIIPQAHTPTLFYAYLMNFGAFFGILVLGAVVMDFINKLRFRYKLEKPALRTSVTVQRVFILISFTFLINSFWFLPNLYFVINHSTSINQSKIHHLFSEEAFLQNKEFGRIEHVALLRNFLFNWGEHVGGGQFGELLDEWQFHLTRPYVAEIGYGIFAVILTGILISFVTRNRYAMSLLSVFVICLFFLFNVNPPLGFVFVFLQNTFPIFKEAFRFPFTKFSILLMFTYGVYFGIFIGYVGWVVDKLLKKSSLVFTSYLYMYSIVVLSLLWYMLPALNGRLISPTMRVDIPSRYFKMFEYLGQQKEYGRVADLPIESFWGWVYHNWNPQTKLGYQGAGFLWFGIKQPLLDREFDRWNLLNEQYYQEMSLAIYSEDVARLETTLEKYKIRWILLDESVLSPGSPEQLMFYPQTKELMGVSNRIALEKDFGEGLKLYKYTPKKDFTLTEKVDTFAYSNDSLFKEYTDPIYEKYGNYVNDSSKNFPYLGITNYDESISKKFISSDKENTYFTNRLTFAKLNATDIDDYVQYYVYLKKNAEESDSYTLKLEDVPGFIRSRVFEYNFKVSIEDKTVLKLDNNLVSFSKADLTEEYKNLGFVKINPSIPLTFEVLKPVERELKLVEMMSRIERCSDTGTQSSYLIAKVPGGFKIGARDLDACVTLNLWDLVRPEDFNTQVLKISAETEEFGSIPSICLLDTQSGLCVNEPLKNGEAYALINAPQSGESSEYFLRFSARAVLKNEETAVAYKNLKIFSFESLLSNKLDISPLTKLEGEFFGRMTLKKDLNFSGNVTSLNYNPRFCNTGQRDFGVSKVDIIKDSHIRYESRGDSLCDSFPFPFARHDTGYILEIRAKNIEGIPLRVCLTNEYSKRCDLYVSLGVGTDYTTHYFLVPPMGKGSGYTVNISNLIFGSGISINELEYIALTPFPYDFIRNVHNDVPFNGNEKLLIYNQAYESGWVALCGFKPCNAKHVMVNNWSNGWIFPGEFDQSNVKIFFWPQILEYIGFILVAVSFVLTKNFKQGD
ncbi:hypothetical protein GYA27_01225 [candidate division WWE3 bacterium]|uniref:Membrane protein 6-pyruvoyl-tetrahydropterin synthase-related domain-containing protein n=1 Tax=candidate division WWE3 bacterium TaxID=2053526 RepID=A0A7X9DKC6_UNCKA|nr:hypothetical protein [candidate division WWE3 bacterium]